MIRRALIFFSGFLAALIVVVAAGASLHSKGTLVIGLYRSSGVVTTTAEQSLLVSTIPKTDPTAEVAPPPNGPAEVAPSPDGPAETVDGEEGTATQEYFDKNTIKVPSVVGMRYHEAQPLIERLELKARGYVAAGGECLGQQRILVQEPAAGDLVEPGTVIAVGYRGSDDYAGGGICRFGRDPGA